MRFITLEQIRIQCRIDDDFTSDDAYLTQLGEVAEEAVEYDMNRHLYVDVIPEDDALTGLLVSLRHKQAMLLMVGQLYENREATSDLTMKEVPLAYQYLIEQDRVIPL